MPPYGRGTWKKNSTRVFNLGWAVTIAILLLVPLYCATPVLAASGGSNSASSLTVSPDVAHKTLTSPNAQERGCFGDAVAMNGTTAVVGAMGETVNGLGDAGRVYIFNARTGTLLHTLSSPNAQGGGYFGDSVAVSGTLVVVGAFSEAADGVDGAGHVYTFDARTGALLQTFTSPNAESGGGFGYQVAISGNILIAGAYDETVNGNQYSGRVYIFNASTGALSHTLTSPGPGGFFGNSVAIGGSTLVVGAPGESVKGMYGAGHAYTFNAITGDLIKTLTSPNKIQSGRFGDSVAISRNTVVVGAPDETVGDQWGAGRAYTFNGVTGARLRTFTSSYPTEFVEFGISVAIGRGTVFVTEATGGAVNSGAVYTFTSRTGALVRVLSSPNAVDYGGFGSALSMSGRSIIVGASAETVRGVIELAGHAYIFYSR